LNLNVKSNFIHLKEKTVQTQISQEISFLYLMKDIGEDSVILLLWEKKHQDIHYM